MNIRLQYPYKTKNAHTMDSDWETMSALERSDFVYSMKQDLIGAIGMLAYTMTSTSIEDWQLKCALMTCVEIAKNDDIFVFLTGKDRFLSQHFREFVDTFNRFTEGPAREKIEDTYQEVKILLTSSFNTVLDVAA